MPGENSLIKTRGQLYGSLMEAVKHGERLEIAIFLIPFRLFKFL